MNRKRILLTSPKFYSYAEILKDALEDLGFDVVCVYYPKSTIYMPVFPCAKTRYLRNVYSYFKNDFDDFSVYCINKIKSFNFDYLLSINIPVSSRLTDILKKNNSRAKSVMYLWDPLNTYDVRSYINNYDKIFTFDLRDAKENGYNYKINFWNADIDLLDQRSNKEYDLVFVGKFSKERADILVSIILNYPEFRCFFRLLGKEPKQSYSFRKWFSEKSEVYKYVFDSIYTDCYIPINHVNYLISKSIGVVDIEILNQYGMSQRVVFALGNRKKILTTNSYLINKDDCQDQIYDIRKINKLSSQELKEWLNKPVDNYVLYEDVKASEVHEWIIDVLELKSK